MAETVELMLGDGTAVLVEVFAAPQAQADAADRPDLPSQSGPVVPVGRGGRVNASRPGLAEVLRPLSGVLDSVHHAASSALRPPSELSVELGLRFSHDLRLGLVSASGEATLTVRASWSPRPAAALPASDPSGSAPATTEPVTTEPAGTGPVGAEPSGSESVNAVPVR